MRLTKESYDNYGNLLDFTDKRPGCSDCGRRRADHPERFRTYWSRCVPCKNLRDKKARAAQRARHKAEKKAEELAYLAGNVRKHYGWLSQPIVGAFYPVEDDE